MTLAPAFEFRRFEGLNDGEVELCHLRNLEGRRALDGVPAYLFQIVRCSDRSLVGEIDLRLQATSYLRLYGGQLGYHIHPHFRGYRYAAKACLLLQRVARAHGMGSLWITCNPDNHASRRTCELIGARYMDTVRVPFASELYWRGDRNKCRYLWDLTRTTSSTG